MNMLSSGFQFTGAGTDGAGTARHALVIEDLDAPDHTVALSTYFCIRSESAVPTAVARVGRLDG